MEAYEQETRRQKGLAELEVARGDQHRRDDQYQQYLLERKLQDQRESQQVRSLQQREEEQAERERLIEQRDQTRGAAYSRTGPCGTELSALVQASPTIAVIGAMTNQLGHHGPRAEEPQ